MIKNTSNTNTNINVNKNNNKINSANNSDFARKLKESSEKMMQRNAEAYRKLAYL